MIAMHQADPHPRGNSRLPNLGVLALVLALATGPARADEELRQEASARMQVWVAEAALRAADPVTASLPAGTTLDRVEEVEGYVAAYVRMPAAFLDTLTDVDCEQIIREQVRLLKPLDGIRGFGIFAKPLESAEAEYRALPEYLPAPEGPLDKPEDITIGLRAGGLPAYNPGRPTGALSGKTVFLSPGHGWAYSSTLGRWATQRGNSYGLIEDHSNGEAVFLHLARYLHNAGANVWPCRERDMNPHMVIIDNTAAAPDVSYTGTWTDSTGAGTWYGTNYKYAAVSTTETAVATYAPSFPTEDEYAVYVWTPSASNRSTAATVRVNHTGGTTTHVINMQQDGNTWRFLGMYHFAAGRNAPKGSVQISTVGSDPSKFVIADAVRFGGGLGDYADGGVTSGWPRWEESGKYFGVFMGHVTTPLGTVDAMPRYAKWESESWEDSVYVSWHSNATGSSYVGHGTDVYVYGPNGPPSPFSEFSGVAGSDSLAVRIRDEIINDLRIAWNDPSWPGRLYTAWCGELNPSNNDEMPGVLIEVAYHDSEVDADSLVDPRFRDMVSRAVYQSIVKWWYHDHDGPNSTPAVNATLLPEPPTHLAVRNLGDGTVRVSWQPPPSNSGNGLLGDPATGYRVQISEDGFGFDDGASTTSTQMDLTGLPAGAIRYVRVIATNAGGQSFPSEIGAVRVRADGPSPLLIVNGFEGMDRWMLRQEDDPYSTDPMRRERPMRMNHYGYSRTFAAALQPTGLAFDYCANEAVRDGGVTLSAYTAVIWQVGEESVSDATFDSLEQSRVAVYLGAGGKLFVSGAEIGYDLVGGGSGVSFYNNILKAGYVADDAETYSVEPVAGSIFDGIGGFAFDEGSTIYDVDWPDVLSANGGSTVALNYVGGTGGGAAAVYDGTYQLVHFGFPFEAITSANSRLAVMIVVLNFFGFDAGEPPLPPPADIILESRDASGVVTPAPAYQEFGAWANSSVKSSAPGLVGTGSRFITYEVPNTGTDHARFVPNVVTPGRYEVLVTWANGANCYDSRHRVSHHLGQTDLLIDQISSGAPEPGNYDQWISLGEYWFAAGQSEAVGSLDISEETVTGRPSPTWNFRVYTDAAKWVYVKAWPNGDADGNGVLTLADFALFPECVSGPAGGYPQSDCEVFDFALDGDVDLDDFAEFQSRFEP